MKTGVILGHLKFNINEGTILRTAEAFGISNIFLLGKISFTGSQGADRHLLFHKFKELNPMLDYLYENSFNVVCIEDDGDSIDYTSAKYPKNPVFVSGHENLGIPEDIKNFSSLKIKIEQDNTYVKCLNTSVAMGIILSDFYNKRRKI
jgi:tRNA G18 (ribose-2'-O)-methylase SpoU